MPNCRICGCAPKDSPQYHVKEMMFGLRDEFLYFECHNCGCLQIAEVPSDISRYYPPGYYSFEEKQSGRLTNVLITKRNRYMLLKKGILGGYINSRYPNTAISALSRIKLSEGSRILDVGCGSGRLLLGLKCAGFKNLLGIDKYIADSITYGSLTIEKKELAEVKGEWNVIMFNHSFEHMANQLETLKAASERLSSQGVCLINVPTVSSYAWVHYRENWVQLDAPRHFFLHSIKSLSLLAEKAKLSVKEVIFNSGGLQFWGSELIKKGLPLSTGSKFFSKQALSSFERRAKKLNALSQGDSAVFYFARD